MDLSSLSHRRYNPLLDEWVLVSPHRSLRPWQGHEADAAQDYRPEYDPGCYLCPGNRRAGGDQNPDYEDVFVFNNDFPALLANKPTGVSSQSSPLLRVMPETGLCRVVCYSPRHDLCLSRMTHSSVNKVVSAWQTEYAGLCGRHDINYVQIFENRGEMMGCSNPHPHGQIWASSSIPGLPATEDANQNSYAEKNSSCLLCDYLELERGLSERLVCENRWFSVLVPFWAVWPFEVLVLPRFHAACISELSEQQADGLAEIIIRLGVRYDNLFNTPFPYSMGIHQAPAKDGPYPHWHFHLHYYPPLLRSARVRKFMVGYEMLAMAQRDITPEQSAQRLREQSDIHYLDKGAP
jgi:UDPglucose--hexose-1-phosphate uridylyltransferase